MRLRTYLTLLITVALVSAAVGTLGGRESTPPALAPTDAAQFLPDIEGSWTGTWEDTLYMVSGAVTCEIIVDGNNWSAVGTIDLSSVGLGVMPGTASGTVAGNTLTFDFHADLVDGGDGTLNGGNGSGTGTVIAPLDFGGFVFVGSASPSMISGNFDFDAPTGGYGIVTLTPGVANEDLSWGDVKARHR